MNVLEIKLEEIVRITQKNKEYDWNSIDIFGRVESVNEKDVHLLLPNGSVSSYEFEQDKEKFEPVEINLASEYLFLSKVDEEIEECQKKWRRLKKT